MDAVHAHLKFKLSALIIALSAVMNNVSHNQLIPVEMYNLCFKHIKRKLHYVRVLADLTRARAVRKAYTIVEARMGYRMIV
jgi:hypothetical protein